MTTLKHTNLALTVLFLTLSSICSASAFEIESSTSSLGRAVNKFNTKMLGVPASENQPPLTVDEVVAVLMKSRSLHEGTYPEEHYVLFEKIGKSKKLPTESYFSHFEHWGSEEEGFVRVWWIDLHIPTENPHKGTVIRIRNRIIGLEK